MTNPTLTVTITERDLATILAALRHWQAEYAPNAQAPEMPPETPWSGYFYDHEPLTEDEIDTLCEDLNTAGNHPYGPTDDDPDTVPQAPSICPHCGDALTSRTTTDAYCDTCDREISDADWANIAPSGGADADSLD